MQEHTHAGEQFVCQLLPGEFMEFVNTRDTLASRAAVQALLTRARGLGRLPILFRNLTMSSIDVVHCKTRPWIGGSLACTEIRPLIDIMTLNSSGSPATGLFVALMPFNGSPLEDVAEKPLLAPRARSSCCLRIIIVIIPGANLEYGAEGATGMDETAVSCS